MKQTALLLALLLPTLSYAWGPTGHRVVGGVAEKYLKRSVKRKIKKLLDGDSLARVSNWPDKIKSDPDQYGHTYNWHYTDWPDDADHYDPVNNNGHLIKAINDNIKVLKNKKAAKKDRVFAISFIVHLVGDLHQPLHVGNGIDRGGNNCKVTFHKEAMNLHRLWDSGMIDFTLLSYTELQDFVNIISKKEAKKLQKGTALDWAKESKAIRQTIYPADVIPNDQLTGTQRKYCQKDLVLPPEEIPNLSYSYSYKFMPVVERRLREAGIRLAMILNDTL